MKKQINVTLNGIIMQANEGDLLSDILNMEKPCGGHAKCGKCKVYACGELSEPSNSEKKILTETELLSGIRLACCTYALGDCTVNVLNSGNNEQILTAAVLPDIQKNPSFTHYGAAIDIGTTTVAARLFDKCGNMLAEASAVNPQQNWGADVISRIESALDGHEKALAEAIRGKIDELILQLALIANSDASLIDGIVITGNSVMLSLLTEQSVEPFSHAPFELPREFGETLTAAELGLTSLMPQASVYLPPCISAFVGADITCAILSTELIREGCAILADIGTNGEIALIKDGRLHVCSTAAGPAFEGVGISRGMRAADGAIDAVNAKDGKLEAHVIGKRRAIGICGSGLIDAAAAMLELEILDESGYLEDDEIEISEGVTLNQNDIRMLQLAKSAICAGLLTLIKSEKLNASDVERLFVAGGFGNYLSFDSAAAIGLIPRAIAERAKSVGNAALAGACMLLLNKDLKAEADNIARSAETLQLHGNAVFSENYMNGMLFCEAE